MTTRIRKRLGAVAVGMVASLAQFVGPCMTSLQFPPENTESFWGIALALAKQQGTGADLMEVQESSARVRAAEGLGPACE